MRETSEPVAWISRAVVSDSNARQGFGGGAGAIESKVGASGPQLRRGLPCSSVGSCVRERSVQKSLRSVASEWWRTKNAGRRGWIGDGASLTHVVSAFSGGRTRLKHQPALPLVRSLIACWSLIGPNRVSEGSSDLYLWKFCSLSPHKDLSHCAHARNTLPHIELLLVLFNCS